MLAYSPVLKSGRNLWERNQSDWNLPLSKFQKLMVGGHLILKDYADGIFPPTFTDQQKAYDAEIAYRESLPGRALADVRDLEMRKPFWYGSAVKTYMAHFRNLAMAFEKLGVQPPQKLLELGCGTGWMAEFLAQMNFQVLGTSISPSDIEDAQSRKKGLEAKRLDVNLDFRVAPMESVDQAVADQMPFDAVFVFEALHHAYDWRRTIEASFACLKPGGWLLIANEPNRLHTFISYRVGRLSNTHEIGMSGNQLRRQMKAVGFRKVRALRNRLSLFVRPHWIAAQK